jgi:adenylate cyclase
LIALVEPEPIDLMSQACNGELVPVGGGDPIPLIRTTLTLGRRESCDVCLRFPNVSGLHCELTFKDGHWSIRDLGSTNGIKVNGSRVQKKVLHPKDVITIAKRKFTIEYVPTSVQRMEEILEEEEDILSQPLLERAGLLHPPRELEEEEDNNRPHRRRHRDEDDV